METAKASSTAGRSDWIIVLSVGGLSALTGALFFWASSALAPAGESAPSAGFAIFVATNAASAGLLRWHRRYPLRVFSAILTVSLVSSLATGTMNNGGLTLPLWFGLFAVAAYAPIGRACIAIAVGWVLGTAVKSYLATVAGYPLTPPELGLIFLGDVGFFYLACGALGLGFRAQHQRASEAAEHARLLEKHARAIHAEAVATERNRLARDLHDLAAHELVDALLSVRALQITSEDPTLPEIEQKTARALENMRAVVRTLRDDDRAEPERLPLAAAAAQTIDDLRAERGVEVASTVRIDGPIDDASASTALSVLKEAVLNAARHAPGAPVTVALDADSSSLRLTVANPPRPRGAPQREGTGYGLVGAAERARLLGGSFEAGRAENGDWVAMLALPRDPAPRDPAPAVHTAAESLTEAAPMEEAR